LREKGVSSAARGISRLIDFYRFSGLKKREEALRESVLKVEGIQKEGGRQRLRRDKTAGNMLAKERKDSIKLEFPGRKGDGKGQ